MRIFGLSDPSRESIGIGQGFFPPYDSAVCYFSGHLGHDFDIFAASGESTAWVLL